MQPSLAAHLTPTFSCKHTTIIATKSHPKSTCQRQRSLGSTLEELLPRILEDERAEEKSDPEQGERPPRWCD